MCLTLPIISFIKEDDKRIGFFLLFEAGGDLGTGARDGLEAKRWGNGERSMDCRLGVARRNDPSYLDPNSDSLATPLW